MSRRERPKSELWVSACTVGLLLLLTVLVMVAGIKVIDGHNVEEERKEKRLER